MRLILICFVFLTVSACEGETQSSLLKTRTITITTQSGDTHKFNVEIADTLETQQTGLMNRAKMPADHGMLFVFPGEKSRNFWMRNTLISLDMLFITEEGIITHIHKNARPHDESPHRSLGLAKMVLEINGGRADALGISEGAILKMNEK